MERPDACYVCGLPATSREHVPPLCLFPEMKEIGLNLRKDLITVPSCDEHNSKKSNDDEFLMVCLAGIYGNNNIGFFHASTKVNRAVRRKSQDFIKKEILRDLKRRTIKSPDGRQVKVSIGSPNFPRLIRCFQSIARGLYFYEYNAPFQGEIGVMPGFIQYTDDNDQTMTEFIRQRFEVEHRALETNGGNPRVFTYQFCSPDEFGIIGLRLVFYDFTDVYIAFTPRDSRKAFHLGVKMIHDGIPTAITLGDKMFHFNEGK